MAFCRRGAVAACLLASGGSASDVDEINWPQEARMLQVPCTASWPVQNCADVANNISYQFGICVQPSTGVYECWDVCNPAHADSSEYQVVVVPPGGSNAMIEAAQDNNTAVAMMINRIRHGKSLDVSCAQNFKDASDWCVPGDRCGGDTTTPANANGSVSLFGSGTTAHAQSIPAGRGICVVDPQGPYGRACWDMCNLNILPSKYSEGSPEAEEIVQRVRDGWDGLASCPHFVWWPWVLGILLCCGIGAGVTVFIMKGYHKKLQRHTRGLAAPQQRFDPIMEEENFSEQPMMDPEVPPQMEQAERMPGSPGMQQREFDMPVVQAPVPQQTTHFHGGDLFGQPNLFGQGPMLASQPPLGQTASMSTGYRATPMLTQPQPSPLSQPPILQTTLPNAFATQPVPISQPGSMQLPPGAGATYFR